MIATVDLENITNDLPKSSNVITERLRFAAPQ
jgi:hypothetical protein